MNKKKSWNVISFLVVIICVLAAVVIGRLQFGFFDIFGTAKIALFLMSVIVLIFITLSSFKRIICKKQKISIYGFFIYLLGCVWYVKCVLLNSGSMANILVLDQTDWRIIVHSLIMMAVGSFFVFFSKYITEVKVPKIFSINSAVRITGWAVLDVIGIELLTCSGAFYRLTWHSFILNVILFILLCAFLSSLLNTVFFAVCMVNAVCFIMVVVNYYTMLFRGTVLLPSDVFAARTAMNVMGTYQFEFNPEFIICFVILSAACLILYPVQKTKNKKRKIFALGISGICLFGFVYAINLSSVRDNLSIGINYWKPTMQSKEEGFLLTFADNLTRGSIQKPEGYSKEKVKELTEQYQTDANAVVEERPNIIVIMNESFADLEEFEMFSASEEIQPYLHSLRDEENVYYGYVQVPVIGGGTSNTEFEFLTGINNSVYSMSSPYDSLNNSIQALPQIMKNLSYTTVALHPEVAANWSRNKGYTRLGFDEFIDITKMINKDKVRSYISDESFYNEIIRIDLENSDPIFLFGITMQNHGGYEVEEYEEEIQILSPQGEYPLASQYINLIHESDKAFMNFIDYYETVEEPTLIVFFGDHFPRIEDEFLNQLVEPLKTGDASDELLLYHTPMYIWANYELDKEEFPQEGSTFSISFLQSVIMKAANLPQSGYQQCLSDVLESYPVVSAGCILDVEGNAVDQSENEILSDYACMQYMLLKNEIK